MQKSLKSPEYARLIAALVAVRHAGGIRQQALAEKLGRPQSFVAKYEGGERRIDVVEFIAIARALGTRKAVSGFCGGKAGQSWPQAARRLTSTRRMHIGNLPTRFADRFVIQAAR
jgi:transcriptional regulator with XRE-family HTH domain